ncbi:murein biosynthesis integral membrane protein MurJ [Algimonas porphyrae]|uniref:Probable lipid II flippase MurJ n=1 Tax=Algimonas porphyrae TaxID=1128113 RepID=A0ABQ5V0N2_9PROT|nr:murein biosynthesis integral membrane protein MurJ [Algimonas porphyrae]GLQ20637.1 putative lipid II flippase MurJ [Algimonas porphyrae]
MRLLRSTAIIASLTLVSRVMGLVRDVLIARFLGAGPVSDAFFTAFKLPNVFRRMFAEGAFNAAFVPLYAKRIEQEGEAAADRFASEAATALFVTVALIVILFQITMPWSLNIIGFGLDRAVNEDGISPYYLAVFFALITMPYLLFMSMTALFSGVLNTRHKFALAAGVPILLNAFMITALLVTPRFGAEQRDIGTALTIAITLSGIAQAAAVIWGAKRAGMTLHIRRPRLTPGVKRLVILGVPGIISAGITQINLVVSHSIATLQDSAASWLTYADRLYQLPLGMIGIAMGVALLPSLSRSLRAGDGVSAMSTQNRAVELSMLFTLPAAMALFIVPDILIAGLFERGAFTADTTEQVAKALRFFALGLPAFVLLKVLTPAFFAREDTRTPMIWAAISAVVNITLGYTLFVTVGFEGLALATSVAAWINVAGLSVLLMRSRHLVTDRRLRQRLPRIMMAASFMGGFLYGARRHVPDLGEAGLLMDGLALMLLTGAGGFVFLLAAMVLRAYGLADIKDAFKRS